MYSPLVSDSRGGGPSMSFEFNVAVLVEATAERVPDRPAVVRGHAVLTYRNLVDRSRRLARYLTDRGLGAHPGVIGPQGPPLSQDLLAQYLYNSAEYIEGLVGS